MTAKPKKKRAATTGDALSPCVAICRLDPDHGWCEGCFRTAEEIAGWLSKSAEQKRDILGRVAERRRHFEQVTRIL